MFEAFDGYAALRNGLRAVAAVDGDWAGIPLPITGERLVIEPTYRNGAELAKIGAKEEEPIPDDVKFRNSWYSRRHRCEVFIWEEGGKILHAFLPHNHLSFLLKTLGCSDAWGLEQERNALKTLGMMLSHRQYKQYILTGCFSERSKRSGLSYIFRRLRPTVVVDARSRSETESLRILCALCMHPIAYYADSHAGAMCPTDDVIAHLALMRGDEPMLWRRSNQHAPWRPEAAI